MHKVNRRAFIGHSSRAALALAVAPAFAASATSLPARPLNKKSLKWGMIQEDGMSVLEKFKMIKELGYDGIELNSPNDLDMNEVLDARDETGLAIPGVVNSVHWKAPLSDPDPAVRQQCVDSMFTSFEECKKYGGTTVLLVPGVVNDQVSYIDAYDRSHKEIKEKILPASRESGIKIAIENVWNNFLLSPMEAARYIDEFEDSHIGWYFDVGNVVRYGWPDQWIRILGQRIMKIDIKEYSRKKQSDEGIWEGFKVPLTEGDSDWAKVNIALAEVGYSAGWGSAEVPGGDRARLLEISQRMDKAYAS